MSRNTAPERRAPLTDPSFSEEEEPSSYRIVHGRSMPVARSSPRPSEESIPESGVPQSGIVVALLPGMPGTEADLDLGGADEEDPERALLRSFAELDIERRLAEMQVDEPVIRVSELPAPLTFPKIAARPEAPAPRASACPPEAKQRDTVPDMPIFTGVGTVARRIVRRPR